ncbi:MAG: Tol-Pal system beta propeller repeat protein TolB [Burkholderiales bacterium 35-55-47]|jgi:TolB protein|uniref:Tol-Pal system beta propeller repeat protein TolB n=1 Tax=Limnohabitans sp. TaxID=1907725 RepID=UPI000BD80B45|nr:Tol-Pal system beta propeller repeat protein TolB [Limnohabitans sp.]OYY20065.1 MAG: Tol-Pal system beta propeller repeat protein TolB [Burkholderiales bacterium 35-55-47]OYZ74325.1 MAG: Tol-Pal system beta propeller repeat protein TolB [Burkholderiales bacterium 24-55-52]OZB01784.1 MAG: Tol-Pal system beta propeller repeat protein TolB [Burkholderiales bacterium 39-55-53]HQR86294.1 Tol-Pal system beta propeller repeat protein TolB [Limnohabitans sp.]HQS25789.1 Tol-Pal system beta propeller
MNLFKNSWHTLVKTALGILLISALAQQAAFAQFRVEVSGVGLTRIPIVFAQFRDEGLSPQPISKIVGSDLERSGQFRAIGTHELVDETQIPDLAMLRQSGADAFVAGSVAKLANGQFEVRFRLWDVVKSEDLGAESFVVTATDLRLAAHRISDFVYENLIAEKGVFSTRVAYVTKSETAYSLWISDVDGENAQSALNSPEPIISPTWSPDGKSVAYVSFEQRKPVVYVHKIADGTRKIVANFKGSNSAPAWEPNGQSLVVALSQNGFQQLYAINLENGSKKKLFSSLGVDTEPVFSADGDTLFFVSDRSGGPQIYRVTLPNGEPERITFTGAQSMSPAISPDGKYLAFISKADSSHKLNLLEIASRVVTPLTDTMADERPSFSPNGRLIVYATTDGGRKNLMMTTIDGRVKSKLATQTGDMREPHWGPYVEPQ